jgi:hypothetical protein
MFWRAALLCRLAGLDLKVHLLVAHVGPELNALQRHLVRLGLHGLQRDGEEGLAHVRLHELVVQGHDLHQALQGGHLHLKLVRLCLSARFFVWEWGAGGGGFCHKQVVIIERMCNGTGAYIIDSQAF